MVHHTAIPIICLIQFAYTMTLNKKTDTKEKTNFHHRSKHRGKYDFSKLTASYPALAPYVHLNKYNDATINFANAKAVLYLNKAILQLDYGVSNWSIPDGYLCPPIPGRADYMHHVADLLGSSNKGMIPTGNQIRCLDIGVGANCIYPIIGHQEYGWSFVGIDIDENAIKSAKKILDYNPELNKHITIIQQLNTRELFRGIPNELFDLSICNPPFHASEKEAAAANLRKINNLNAQRISKPRLNFGGKNNELWCEGGEALFVHNMITQSKEFATQVFWFTTLISKQDHLPRIYQLLKKVSAAEVVTINMQHGNKTSRIVAWTFLNKDEQKNWITKRWEKLTYINLQSE